MKSAIVRNVFERQIQGIMPTHQKNVRADSNTRGWTNVRWMHVCSAIRSETPEVRMPETLRLPTTQLPASQSTFRNSYAREGDAFLARRKAPRSYPPRPP